MGCVYYKDGVLFSRIAPGGFRILSAIDQTAASLDLDLIITSACDGAHSGPMDPHHMGAAYDVRSHNLTQDQKDKVLASIMAILGTPFFGFIEDPGGDNEHLHIQVRKGTSYPDPFAKNDSGTGGSKET